MPEEAAYLDALRAGEPWAVERLYREHAARVLAWAIRLGGPRIDPEDASQEVFIVALRRVAGFRGDCALSTWLFGITRRVLANARRRAAIRRFVGLEALPAAAGPSSDEQAARLLRRRRVQRALERLKENQRLVLVLVDLEQRSAPEVAELLGIPAGTVYSRLHHARRAFALALKREGLSAEDASSAEVIPLERGR